MNARWSWLLSLLIMGCGRTAEEPRLHTPPVTPSVVPEVAPRPSPAVVAASPPSGPAPSPPSTPVLAPFPAPRRGECVPFDAPRDLGTATNATRSPLLFTWTRQHGLWTAWRTSPTRAAVAMERGGNAPWSVAEVDFTPPHERGEVVPVGDVLAWTANSVCRDQRRLEKCFHAQLYDTQLRELGLGRSIRVREWPTTRDVLLGDASATMLLSFTYRSPSVMHLTRIADGTEAIETLLAPNHDEANTPTPVPYFASADRVWPVALDTEGRWSLVSESGDVTSPASPRELLDAIDARTTLTTRVERRRIRIERRTPRGARLGNALDVPTDTTATSARAVFTADGVAVLWGERSGASTRIRLATTSCAP